MKSSSSLHLAGVLFALLFLGFARRADAAPFQRGDANADGAVDVADPVLILFELFVHAQPGSIACEDAADANDDGAIRIGDSIAILGFLFLGGSPPPQPSPGQAGFDPTTDDPFDCGDPPPLPDASSAELIERALAEGAIDAETALIYGVFAAFADPRLPPAFAGNDSRVTDSDAIHRAIAGYDGLSPAARTLIDPFLLPPSAPGSWLELRAGEGGGAAISWATMPAVGGLVKVWWQVRRPQDEAIAIVAADAMTTTIWPTLVDTIMGRRPKPDGALLNNGGDEALDIYLVGEIGVAGLCQPYAPRCANSPAYILLNTATADARFRSKLAHEFFHAIQLAYTLPSGCLGGPEYGWLAEATATWAEDAVYPDDNREQVFAADYLNDAARPIEVRDNPYRAYGAYLFPFFVTRSRGQPTLVRTIWESIEGGADSLAALNAAVASSGGLEKEWPRFAVSTWGRPPFDDYYRWDELPIMPPPEEPAEVRLDGAPDTALTFLDVDMQHMSIRYYHLKFTDASVRTVVFYNGFTFELREEEPEPMQGLGIVTHVTHRVDAQTRKGGNLQALIKIAGQDWETTPEDWTDRPIREFCRDRRDERLEELVLIFSNSEFRDRGHVVSPQGLPPTLVASNGGCFRWKGEATVTIEADDITTTFRANATFERLINTGLVGDGLGAAPVPDIAFRPLYPFYAVEGTLDASISGTDSAGCTFSGSRTGMAFDTNGLNVMNIYHLSTRDPFYRGVQLAGFLGPGGSLLSFQVTVACPDVPAVTSRYDIPPLFESVDERARPTAFLAADGANIRSRTIVLGIDTVTLDFNLHAEREE